MGTASQACKFKLAAALGEILGMDMPPKLPENKWVWRWKKKIHSFLPQISYFYDHKNDLFLSM